MKMENKWLNCLIPCLIIFGLGLIANAQDSGNPIINLKAEKFEISGQMQVRGSFETNDFDTRRGDDNDMINFRRVRLEFKGDFSKEVGFFVRPEFKGTNTQLLDAYVKFNYAPLPTIYAGSLVTALSMESNQSNKTELETLERAQIVNLMRSFEPGVKVEDKLLDKKLYYCVTATNGNGNYTQTNDNNHLFYVGRINYKALNDIPLGPEKLSLNAGASYGYSQLGMDRANTLFAVKTRGLQTLAGVEMRLTYGQAALQTEYIKVDFNPAQDGRRNVHMNGYYIQGSYFMLPNKLRAVAKYEAFDPDDAIKNYKDNDWTTFGLTYLIKGHDLKVEANYVIKDEAKDDLKNNAVYIQVQVLF
jgi:phosphate-selective porin